MMAIDWATPAIVCAVEAAIQRATPGISRARAEELARNYVTGCRAGFEGDETPERVAETMIRHRIRVLRTWPALTTEAIAELARAMGEAWKQAGV